MEKGFIHIRYLRFLKKEKPELFCTENDNYNAKKLVNEEVNDVFGERHQKNKRKYYTFLGEEMRAKVVTFTNENGSLITLNHLENSI